MPLERLGTYRTQIDNQPREAEAFVFWLDEPLRAIAGQLRRLVDPETRTLRCPSCARGVDIDRLESLAALRDARVSTVSVTCPHCGAIVHFDRTPEADRARLQWTKTYRR